MTKEQEMYNVSVIDEKNKEIEDLTERLSRLQ
jgi:hypothetical protein